MVFMKILGIETSCDETALALLFFPQKGSPKILFHFLFSQIKIHRKYGGVFPSLAKRAHQEILPIFLEKALKKMNEFKKEKVDLKKESFFERIQDKDFFEKLKNILKKYPIPKIDLLAIAQGPGLEPCLWQGVNFAKILGRFWKLKIVPVNHLEAHILINLFKTENKDIFPAIGLVASGGHTELYFIQKDLSFKKLGETLDDAAGECLDKTARMLGLPYPGGPELEKLAQKAKHKVSFKFPRPLISSKDFNFSFSGLKTAVLYFLQKRGEKFKKRFLPEIAREIQNAVFETLIQKTINAAKFYHVKSILTGGGVLANKMLKKEFLRVVKKMGSPFKIYFPNKSWAQDNGIMIAFAGFLKRKKAVSWQKIFPKANLK